MPPPPAAITADIWTEAGSGGHPATAAGSIAAAAGPPWKRLAGFLGPGYLVAVGYMDPGNWATDIAGGSAFGYQLLSVVLLSNCIAMVLQAMAAKLGIVTGQDLAQACRSRYSPAVSVTLWILCEIAIIACDLAELIGTAVALELLFGLPLAAGICVAGANVFIVMALERRGFRKLEALVIGLMMIVAACLGIELLLSKPDLGAIAGGLVPHARLVTDPAMLYLATGIIGATVMPHNLYLHSSLVQARSYPRDRTGLREAIRFASIDSTVALGLALLVNAAILILAASTFHVRGQHDVAELGDAYKLLAPALGTAVASALFGIALLASGQNATITGSLAGQIVMEGFTRFRMTLWKRRIVARAAAIVPAALIAMLYGGAGLSKLLILSQVVLSAQLPFAAVPLMRMCNDPLTMGTFVNGFWTKITVGGCVLLIVVLNAWLAYGTLLKFVS